MDSDELLIELMCEDNEDAIYEFRRRYLGYIKNWLASYSNLISYFRLDIEDFVSDLYIRVYDSLSEYRPEYGYFYSFARSCVHNYMLSYLKKMNCDNRKALLTSLSIDTTIDGYHTFEDLIKCNYSISSLEDRYDSKVSVNSIKSVMNDFDDTEKKIVCLKYNGVKFKEIVSIIKQKDRSVEYKVANIKKKLTSCIKT